MDKNEELWCCIEEIVKLYTYDTITLLDCVLTDDPINPEYSANTTYYRFENILLFENAHFQHNISSVDEYLLKKGYSSDEVKLLNSKRVEENIRHGKM